MEWETPEFVEISLACEISGYAGAELSAPISALPSDAPSPTKNERARSTKRYTSFTNGLRPDKL